MLNSIIVSRDKLDLDGMLKAYASFWERRGDSPEEAACLSEGLEDTPMPNDEGVDLRVALLENGNCVFLPIHESAVDDLYQAIDGRWRKTGKLDIGEMDSYGVLLEPRGKEIAIHPALYDGSSGPFPRLRVESTASALEGVLQRFMTRYVRD